MTSLLRWCQKNSKKVSGDGNSVFSQHQKWPLPQLFPACSSFEPADCSEKNSWISLNFMANGEKKVAFWLPKSAQIFPLCTTAALFQHVCIIPAWGGGCFTKTPSRLTTCHKGLFVLRLLWLQTSFTLKLHGFVPEKALNHLASLNKEAIKVHIPLFF